MIKSFLELVNESQEIDEMGISNLTKLKNSGIGKVGIEQEAIREYSKLDKKIKNKFIELDSSDISMVFVQPDHYHPIFNDQELLELIQQVRELVNNNPQLRAINPYSNFGKWYQLDNNTSIYMKAETGVYQRSHFPGGIPNNLRGIGLGKKLYLALVRKVGYISSNLAGSREKDSVWASMVQAKRNPDGTYSNDDLHAIVGPSNWMVFDKSISNAKLIRVAHRFIKDRIGPNNIDSENFSISDELLNILPDTTLSLLPAEYLDSLVEDDLISQERRNAIIDAEGQREAEERARLDRDAEEERRRRDERDRELINSRQNRIERFGVRISDDWNVGDFIVVREYLLQEYDPLPIRKVVQFENGEYTAVNIKDVIRIENGEITPNQASDPRRTSNKSVWAKVELLSIPNLDNVNLNPVEKEYILSLRSSSPRKTPSNQHTNTDSQLNTEEQPTVSPNINQTTQHSIFNTPSTGAQVVEALRNRSNVSNINLLKKLKSDNFVRDNNFIILSDTERAALPNQHGIPVYIPWRGFSRNPRPVEFHQLALPGTHMTHSLTGEELPNNQWAAYNLKAYRLSEVTVDDKIRARDGNAFYIAKHQNTYGLIAKSIYGTRNRSQQPFVYLNVYGQAGRPVSVRLDLLKNIREPIDLNFNTIN
ncbi:MAG: hypothetical protein WC123_03675 [Bacilli bacterium]